MVIQIAQPQVPNPKQDMLDLKSSMCQNISNAAKTILSVDITGKNLFESIGSLSAPATPLPLPLPIPFTFTSTKVNPVSKVITKPSTKSPYYHLISPPRLPPSSRKLQVGSNHHRPLWCIFIHDRHPLIIS